MDSTRLILARKIGKLYETLGEILKQYGPDCRWFGCDDGTLKIKAPDGDIEIEGDFYSKDNDER